MGIADAVRPHSFKLKRWLTLALVALSFGNAAALAAHDVSAPTVGPVASAVAPTMAPSSTVAPAPTAAPSVTKPHLTTPAKKAPSTTPSTAEPVPQFPLMSEGYDYEIVLAPTCAKPGETFFVTLKLKPKWGSSGTLMPFYADGSNEKGTGQIAKPDGTVTYSWVAQPIPGEGRLVTQARDADSGQYGTKIIAFRVAEANKSC